MGTSIAQNEWRSEGKKRRLRSHFGPYIGNHRINFRRFFHALFIIIFNLKEENIPSTILVKTDCLLASSKFPWIKR